MSDVFYRIVNEEGLFSSGGSPPRFTRAGKLWRGLGPLRNHLNTVAGRGCYEGCELIRYELSEADREPVEGILGTQERRVRDRLNASRRAAERRKVENEKAELERLRKKYG